jgi:prefoldin subunit 5
MRSVNDGVVGSEKKGTDGKDDILVPLTSSLYVKGRLSDRGKVLVDVGTGFYVEKVWMPAPPPSLRRCIPFEWIAGIGC